jgi:hypothetical protein
LIGLFNPGRANVSQKYLPFLKVKLIYIDPPYNTGNDSFNYNDNFNHSTWLTFMKNRLEVARELLSDDGVIFVCRAKRLLPLMIRLSLIKPFSLRLKFTLSLTPFWVYFLALVMTFLFNKRLISSLASTSLKNISLRFSSDDKNFLIDSYTKFVNKVGLTISNKHIKEINEMELSFPFKDCVLEGGQSKDDE